MGSRTDAQLEAFALATGVIPAKGDRHSQLEEVQRLAFEIIKLAERELTGIRDGDGYWYGCNPLDGTIIDLYWLWRADLRTDPAPAECAHLRAVEAPTCAPTHQSISYSDGAAPKAAAPSIISEEQEKGA